MAAGRTGIAALALVAIATAAGQGLDRVPGRAGWRAVVVVGAVSTALPFTLLSWGIQHVPSAFAGVAMGSGPLLMLPLVAIFSPEEGIGPRRVIGVAMGFVGLVLLIGSGAMQDTGSPLAIWGEIACVGAAACYAVGSVVTRRAPAMPPLAFAAAAMVVAALLLLPIALWREGLPTGAGPGPLAALVVLALFPTALASALRIRIITTAGSLFMSLVSYLVPVWSVILGVALLGERLPPQLYAALALILAGIAVSQSRSIAAALRRPAG